jgi:DNA-binding NarL/FixJ family response regulator
MKNGIRILLADDHPVVRAGIRSCLAKHSRIEIVGEAADGKEALVLAKQLTPDVVLMDIEMPQMSGLAVTEKLTEELPDTRVVILTMNDNADSIMRMIQAGARGYVLKESPTEELLKAIETVSAGESYFTAEVARLALNQFVEGSAGGAGSQITDREREVLILIAEGLSNKEIATRLDVGVRTVETHRERIMRKLNIHSVAGLTKYAISNGLVTLSSHAERH